MPRIFFSFFCFFLCFGLAAQESGKGYRIFIIQDGTRIEIKKGIQNEVVLKPATFKLEIHLYHLGTISLFASVPDTFYRTADTVSFPTCMMLGGIGVAEEMFNPDRSMYVDVKYDDGCNYWNYDSPKDNRFDQVIHDSKDSVVCIRTVSVISMDNRKSYKIKNQSQDLYLVFFNMDSEKCDEEGFEMHGVPDRRYLKLSFRP